MVPHPKRNWTRSAWALAASLVLGQMAAAHVSAQDMGVNVPMALDRAGWDGGGSVSDESEGYDDTVSPDVCNDCCCQPCCCCSCFTLMAGTILLSRDSESGQSFLFRENEIEKPGEEILDGHDFGSDWAGGPDLSLIGCLDCCRSLEVRYFGIDGWSDSVSAGGDVFVVLPWAAVPASGTATFINSSDLYSVEVNLRRWTSDWLMLLAGFRYLEFGDDLLLRFAAPGASPVDIYDIDVDNHLYGGQIGAEARLGWLGPCRFDGWLKAGVFANDADQTTSLFVPIAAVGGASGEDAAMLGSAGLSALLPLTCRLDFCLGYQALWLEGVALAPSQLGVTNLQNNLAELDMNGGVFFHGCTIGLEIRL